MDSSKLRPCQGRKIRPSLRTALGYLTRHGCGATICRENAIEFARRLLGHADISTTPRYMHLNNRELDDAQDLVDERAGWRLQRFQVSRGHHTRATIIVRSSSGARPLVNPSTDFSTASSNACASRVQFSRD